MFLKLTRAVGSAKGAACYVNFDHVTDFSRGVGRDATGVYFSAGGKGEQENFGLFVCETPEAILAMLQGGRTG